MTTTLGVPSRLFCAPVAGLVPVGIDEANALVEAWGHDLGPCRRVLTNAYVLDVGGRSVSVAISAHTTSQHVVGARGERWEQKELVELARLCSNPFERWATRPMLRLWREVIAPEWPYWAPLRAVSYSTKRHTGDLYRFDGWTDCGLRAASGGGGNVSKPRPAGHPAKGPKRLWCWEYA